jgi:hypothetical protein
VVAFADVLSCLDIGSLEIQEEEVLTLLPGSENNNAYCLDLQRESKSQGINILNDIIFFAKKTAIKIYIPQ